MTRDELQQEIRKIEARCRDEQRKILLESDKEKTELCLKHGGHFWWDDKPKVKSQRMAVGFMFFKARRCSVCDYREVEELRFEHFDGSIIYYTEGEDKDAKAE